MKNSESQHWNFVPPPTYHLNTYSQKLFSTYFLRPKFHLPEDRIPLSAYNLILSNLQQKHRGSVQSDLGSSAPKRGALPSKHEVSSHSVFSLMSPRRGASRISYDRLSSLSERGTSRPWDLAPFLTKSPTQPHMSSPNLRALQRSSIAAMTHRVWLPFKPSLIPADLPYGSLHTRQVSPQFVHTSVDSDNGWSTSRNSPSHETANSDHLAELSPGPRLKFSRSLQSVQTNREIPSTSYRPAMRQDRLSVPKTLSRCYIFPPVEITPVRLNHRLVYVSHQAPQPFSKPSSWRSANFSVARAVVAQVLPDPQELTRSLMSPSTNAFDLCTSVTKPFPYALKHDFPSLLNNESPHLGPNASNVLDQFQDLTSDTLCTKDTSTANSEVDKAHESATSGLPLFDESRSSMFNASNTPEKSPFCDSKPPTSKLASRSVSDFGGLPSPITPFPLAFTPTTGPLHEALHLPCSSASLASSSSQDQQTTPGETNQFVCALETQPVIPMSYSKFLLYFAKSKHPRVIQISHRSCCCCCRPVLYMPTSSGFDALRNLWIDAAVITIQRYWRGWKGRAKARQVRQYRKWHRIASGAATAIQAFTRVFLSRLRNQQLHINKFVAAQRLAAARKIQRAWIRYRRICKEHENRLVEAILRIRAAAAIEIQRAYRGYKTRCYVDLQFSHWVIQWRYDHPKQIIEVIGSFTVPPWTKRILLNWNPVMKQHTVVLPRIIGQHELKFIVNGTYCCDGSLTVVSDGTGHYNNVVQVTPTPCISPFRSIRHRLEIANRKASLCSPSSSIDFGFEPHFPSDLVDATLAADTFLRSSSQHGSSRLCELPSFVEQPATSMTSKIDCCTRSQKSPFYKSKRKRKKK